MSGLLLAAVAAGFAVAGQAGAQAPSGPWPRCDATRDGQQLGSGGSVCECRQAAGGTMLRRPPGWRWSCDILRMDGSQLGAAADAPSSRQGLPPGFTYAPQGGVEQPGPFERRYRP